MTARYWLALATLVAFCIPAESRESDGLQTITSAVSKPAPTLTSLIKAADAPNPIESAQILAAAEKTFPNLFQDLKHSELLQKAAADPTLRGNLLGRIAEEDLFLRDKSWTQTRRRNAPENDGWRWTKGRDGWAMEGVQVKVRKNWRKYIRDMMHHDTKAEFFAVPDDHYRLVWDDFEKRRIGALRGGLTEKADSYARQQQRLMKLGRSFGDYERALDSTAKHFKRVSAALRNAGKAASFVGVAVALLDGGCAVYELAQGKISGGKFLAKVSKAGVASISSYYVASVAASYSVTLGATGAVPVVVAIVVGTATYLVVDWTFDKATVALQGGVLSAQDVQNLWGSTTKGVPPFLQTSLR
jgi:hypothetical protein